MEPIQLYTEKEILSEIRESLRARRVALGLTQVEAAAKAGLSQRTLQNFETSGTLSFGNLIKLLFVYRMERRIADSFADRNWWKLNEVLATQKKVRVRNGS